MITEKDFLYWFNRGADDERRDKPSLFRKIGAKYYANGDPPADWTPEEEHAKGEAYEQGRDEQYANPRAWIVKSSAEDAKRAMQDAEDDKAADESERWLTKWLEC